jgi:hypothetical protein
MNEKAKRHANKKNEPREKGHLFWLLSNFTQNKGAEDIKAGQQ